MGEHEAQVVLAEDDEATQKIVCDFLQELGCEVLAFGAGQAAWDYLQQAPTPDCLILDIQLPGMNGLEIFRRTQELHPSLPVIFITGYGDTDQAVRAIKEGAYYYFSKPIDFLLLQRTVGELLEKVRLKHQLQNLKERREDCGLVGRHPSILRAIERIKLVADLPTTVLITGETGTGKELVARAIHQSGSRRQRSFVAVNCAALPENLLESELFGYERGAYTGATDSKAGKFELAHRGTLFLDEIADLPLILQGKLLRVLETKEVERLGSLQSRKIDVRFLLATNQNLLERISTHHFRQDLYFRTNSFEITLPPLRERLDDIPLLVHGFLEELNQNYKRKIESLDPEVLAALRSYEWPGNVRELKHILESAVIVCAGRRLTLAHLPQRSVWTHKSDSAKLAPLLKIEYDALAEALGRCKGNCSAAARLLGISRNQMRHRMKKFGLHT